MGFEGLRFPRSKVGLSSEQTPTLLGANSGFHRSLFGAYNKYYVNCMKNSKSRSAYLPLHQSPNPKVAKLQNVFSKKHQKQSIYTYNYILYYNIIYNYKYI